MEPRWQNRRFFWSHTRPISLRNIPRQHRSPTRSGEIILVLEKALAIAGWIEVVIANPTDALDLFRRAERLSPRDPRRWFIAGGLAHAYLTQGEFDAAISCARKALLYNPRYGPGLRFLAAGLAKLGRRDEAAAAVHRLLRIEPQLTLSSLRARVMFMDESVWDKLADGLRLAGLPE
jgi:tetratricopeptide (TPR) repeat protein